MVGVVMVMFTQMSDVIVHMLVLFIRIFPVEYNKGAFLINLYISVWIFMSLLHLNIFIAKQKHSFAFG